MACQKVSRRDFIKTNWQKVWNSRLSIKLGLFKESAEFVCMLYVYINVTEFRFDFLMNAQSYYTDRFSVGMHVSVYVLSLSQVTLE